MVLPCSFDPHVDEEKRKHVYNTETKVKYSQHRLIRPKITRRFLVEFYRVSKLRLHLYGVNGLCP